LPYRRRTLGLQKAMPSFRAKREILNKKIIEFQKIKNFNTAVLILTDKDSIHKVLDTIKGIPFYISIFA
jgi:hypothetical protein